MNYNEFLDNYIEFRKIRFLKDLQEKFKDNKNLDLDLKTEDLLFLLLIYLRELLKKQKGLR
jgi:hypothetical protein